ncbi:Cation channel sperm-associated protein 4, partial [Blyttiomyces sp. JEL0837]
FIQFWKQAWNIFDVVIVVSSLAGPAIPWLMNAQILRTVRVVRAFRSLRSITIVNGLQTVVQTIVDSIPDMINVIILLLILMFIWAVVGVTLFGPYLPESFGDLQSTMFTLFVMITQIGWVESFDKLEADGQFTAAAIYYASFMIVGVFIFMKIIVAVVVSNLDEAYANQKKELKKKYRALKSSMNSTQGKKQFQRPIRHIPDGEDPVWKNQIPYEIPDFDKISKAKVENYYLILTIMEENLKEYVRLKDQLQEILFELRVINASLGLDEDEDDLGASREMEDEGDALTRMLKTKVMDHHQYDQFQQPPLSARSFGNKENEDQVYHPPTAFGGYVYGGNNGVTFVNPNYEQIIQAAMGGKKNPNPNTTNTPAVTAIITNNNINNISDQPTSPTAAARNSQRYSISTDPVLNSPLINNRTSIMMPPPVPFSTTHRLPTMPKASQSYLTSASSNPNRLSMRQQTNAFNVEDSYRIFPDPPAKSAIYSQQRSLWSRMAKMWTFLIPDFCLVWLSGMDSRNAVVRKQAWREKVFLVSLLSIGSLIVFVGVEFASVYLCPGGTKRNESLGPCAKHNPVLYILGGLIWTVCLIKVVVTVNFTSSTTQPRKASPRNRFSYHQFDTSTSTTSSTPSETPPQPQRASVLLRSTTANSPNPQTIVLVSVYNEPLEVLAKTFESIAASEDGATNIINDGHTTPSSSPTTSKKLMMVIVDGDSPVAFQPGSGWGDDSNSKGPTPSDRVAQILNLLGADLSSTSATTTTESPSDNEIPRSYFAVGPDSRRHNAAVVYAGFFRNGILPYLVIVKTGTRKERLAWLSMGGPSFLKQREKLPVPGNRGKLDSVLICLEFLGKVNDLVVKSLPRDRDAFDSGIVGEKEKDRETWSMSLSRHLFGSGRVSPSIDQIQNQNQKDVLFSPLEHEIYHKLTRICRVNPRNLKYLVTVDGDTFVCPAALYTLVSDLEDGKDNLLAVRGDVNYGLFRGHIVEGYGGWWTSLLVTYPALISNRVSSRIATVPSWSGALSAYRIHFNNRTPCIVHPDLLMTLRWSTEQDASLHFKLAGTYAAEDRGLASLLLATHSKHHRNVKVKLDPAAKAVTKLPSGGLISILRWFRRCWISRLHVLVNHVSGWRIVSRVKGNGPYQSMRRKSATSLDGRIISSCHLIGMGFTPAVTIYVYYIIVRLLLRLFTVDFEPYNMVRDWKWVPSSIITMGSDNSTFVVGAFPAGLTPVNLFEPSMVVSAAVLALVAIQFLLLTLSLRIWEAFSFLVYIIIGVPLFQILLPIYAICTFDDLRWAECNSQSDDGGFGKGRMRTHGAASAKKGNWNPGLNLAELRGMAVFDGVKDLDIPPFLMTLRNHEIARGLGRETLRLRKLTILEGGHTGGGLNTGSSEFEGLLELDTLPDQKQQQQQANGTSRSLPQVPGAIATDTSGLETSESSADKSDDTPSPLMFSPLLSALANIGNPVAPEPGTVGQNQTKEVNGATAEKDFDSLSDLSTPEPSTQNTSSLYQSSSNASRTYGKRPFIPSHLSRDLMLSSSSSSFNSRSPLESACSKNSYDICIPSPSTGDFSLSSPGTGSLQDSEGLQRKTSSSSSASKKRLQQQKPAPVSLGDDKDNGSQARGKSSAEVVINIGFVPSPASTATTSPGNESAVASPTNPATTPTNQSGLKPAFRYSNSFNKSDMPSPKSPSILRSANTPLVSKRISGTQIISANSWQQQSQAQQTSSPQRVLHYQPPLPIEVTTASIASAAEPKSPKPVVSNADSGAPRIVSGVPSQYAPSTFTDATSDTASAYFPLSRSATVNSTASTSKSSLVDIGNLKRSESTRSARSTNVIHLDNDKASYAYYRQLAFPQSSATLNDETGSGLTAGGQANDLFIANTMANMHANLLQERSAVGQNPKVPQQQPQVTNQISLMERNLQQPLEANNRNSLLGRSGAASPVSGQYFPRRIASPPASPSLYFPRRELPSSPASPRASSPYFPRRGPPTTQTLTSPTSGIIPQGMSLTDTDSHTNDESSSYMSTVDSESITAVDIREEIMYIVEEADEDLTAAEIKERLKRRFGESALRKWREFVDETLENFTLEKLALV